MNDLSRVLLVQLWWLHASWHKQRDSSFIDPNSSQGSNPNNSLLHLHGENLCASGLDWMTHCGSVAASPPPMNDEWLVALFVAGL
jgi:hypothetical protein